MPHGPPHSAYTPPSVAFKPTKSNPRPGVLTKYFAPPKPKPPGARPGFIDSAEQEADRIIAELLAELGLARDSARREAERSAQREIERAQALAQALQQLGIAGNIQGIYQSAGQSLAGLAGGFSGEVRDIAAAQGAEQANMLAGTGQEGAVRNEGVGMGDVLYGAQGYIPARGLEQMGAAFASEAALQPGFALQFGQIAASNQMRDFVESVLPGFTDKEALIRSKKPSLVAEARDRRKAEAAARKQEALMLYEAGLITQREFARRMGVKNWRRFPNKLPGQGAAKVNTSLSKALGYLVDDYGNPIKDAKGKPIPLPEEPDEPTIRTQGGYIWERGSDGKWYPVGGTGPAPDKPPNLQSKTIGGKVYVFDPATGTFYDPKTGRPTVPRGSAGGSRKFTPSQIQDFKGQSHSLAEDFRRGVAAAESKDGEEIPPRTYGEAIQEALRSGIPLNIFIPILNRYYLPGQQGRPIKPSRLKDYGAEPGRGSGKGEPAEGGRKNVAFSGPESLDRSLWDAYSYGIEQGFTNLGTHNPESRLPGGGISDHAVYPAFAFDLGFSPGNGWKNQRARSLFWWMTRQPGVEYVILGNKIWSRSRGLHAYTSGGHEGHIHVSGNRGGRI